MMHECSVHPYKLRKNISNDIHGGIHMFYHIYSIASWATCFVVSVPAQEFHFSPTPQLYMQNVNLGSKL